MENLYHVCRCFMTTGKLKFRKRCLVSKLKAIMVHSVYVTVQFKLFKADVEAANWSIGGSLYYSLVLFESVLLKLYL